MTESSLDSAYNDETTTSVGAGVDANGFAAGHVAANVDANGFAADCAAVNAGVDANGFAVDHALGRVDANGFLTDQAPLARVDANGFPIQEDGRVEPSDASGFPVSYGAADYVPVPNEAEPSATMLGQPNPGDPSDPNANRPKMVMGVGVLPDGGISGLLDNMTSGMNS